MPFKQFRLVAVVVVSASPPERCSAYNVVYILLEGCSSAQHPVTFSLAPLQVAKARLPAAVEAFLQDRGVSFRQLQPGLLEVWST